MDKDQWIKAFTQHLKSLGTKASTARLASLAEGSYELFGGIDAIKVAQIEFDFWPNNEGDFADTER
jgi:hypothetical protein